MELTGNVAGIIKMLGGGEGSDVTIEPLVTSGLQIAKVTIDEKVLYLYIPTPQDVDVDAVITSGTKIAEITINNEVVEIYAPSPTNVSVTPALQSGTKIADISVNEVNVPIYAPEGGGGGGVVYSLTEHIVGKWLDGRDIYERTYNVGSISIGSFGTVISIDNANDIDRVLYMQGISQTESMDLMSYFDGRLLAYFYRTEDVNYITLRYIKNG